MKITISKIPGIFPSGYSEQLYVDARSVRSGIDSFVNETAKRVQIVDDQAYRKRKIQSVIYDKYTIKFITTESVDIDMLNYAGEVIITLDNGEQHLAEFIEVPTFEKLGQSEFREYTVTYRDLYSKKTINHLVYSSVTNPTYYTLIKYNGGTHYTQLYPEFGLSEWDLTSNKDNYNEQISSESAYKTIKATFYILTTGVPNFIKELNYDNLALTYMQVSSVKYYPLETPMVDVEETEMEGVSTVNITIKYEQILNYPLA